MKIIGKNSLSQYIAYFMYFMFVVFLFHFVYEAIGHLILWYKYESGNKIFDNTFILAYDIGWTKNKWTIPMENDLKFRINYPFTNIQAVCGLYPNLSQIIHNMIGLIFMTLFFYFAYQCFKEMATDKLFNLKAIKWLKRFGLLNIIFATVGIFEFFYLNDNSGVTFITHIFIGFFGIIILFIMEFFKKGLALQTENDLTI